MTPVALAFAVLELTDSPTALGLVLAAEAVPLVALLLVGGVWADRLPRIRVMLAADVASAAGQGAMAVLLISGHAQVWQLAALAAVAGAADAFHTPALAGLLPATVPAPMLQRANALRHLESNVMRVVGAAARRRSGRHRGRRLGDRGRLLLVPGRRADPVAHPAGAGGARRAERPASWASWAEGWRAVRSHSWLLAMMLDTALWCLVILGPYLVLGPVVSKRELGGAGAWALISAAHGVGSVAGGALGLRLHPRRPLLVAVVINAAFVPLLGLLAVAAPTWLIAISGVPAGASIALYMVLWDTTIQERVPADVLARVSSFERVATFALMPLGMALAGPVAEVLGVGATLWASAAWLGVSTVFLLAIPSVRGLERASAPAAAASG